MGNVIFKIMAFSIMLNFAVGLMTLAVPGFEYQAGSGITYQTTYQDELISGLNGTTNPGGVVTSGTQDRIFDLTGLGFIEKLQLTVNKYMFGFVNVLEGVFGKWLEPAVQLFTFTFLKWTMSIMYLIGIVSLFTATDVTK